MLDSGPLPSSEDFTYYSELLPCCFFFIGAEPEGESYSHHHPKKEKHENK
ncbi:MAG TPA: amidohydrolase [Clostridiaceae bacterium]|nr:amidohydrolase [Clostridiaceae bacterium]